MGRTDPAEWRDAAPIAYTSHITNNAGATDEQVGSGRARTPVRSTAPKGARLADLGQRRCRIARIPARWIPRRTASSRWRGPGGTRRHRCRSRGYCTTVLLQLGGGAGPHPWTGVPRPTRRAPDVPRKPADLFPTSRDITDAITAVDDDIALDDLPEMRQALGA